MESPPLKKGWGLKVRIDGKIEYGSSMKCLRCQGTMLVERQYTKVSRRFNARCVNCGFWFDLADVLRFFKRVLESGAQGQKIRETL